jgi:putative ABC transport system ATP-binding protein
MSLTLSNVSLTVGDGDQQVTALDAVDLHVEDGELVAVVGPSGSGKSSLLAVAGALRTPDAGQVSVDGVHIESLSAKERTLLRRDKVGFVFQASNLVPSLTAVEQLELIEHLRGRRAGHGRDAAMALLDEVGMRGPTTDRRSCRGASASASAWPAP